MAEKFPEIQILAEFDKASTAAEFMHQQPVDFVFLDIQLNGELGIDLLRYFDKQEITFDIIFTTTYGGFALEAFAMSAIDYVLKPIDINRLVEAVQRVLNKKNISPEKLDVFQEISLSGSIRRIVLPMQGKKVVLHTHEIQFLKADNVYTEVHTEEEVHIVSKPLKEYEPLLSLNCFYKTHRSYIVNLNAIASYQTSSQEIEMKNGAKVRLAKEKIREFEEKLNSLI